MGMVLERAGGWSSITDFVKTNGYNLETLNTLYSSKLKPSFDSIFPPRGQAVEGTTASDTEAVESVAAESATALTNMMDKQIAVPFTSGRTVSGKMVMVVASGVGVGIAAYSLYRVAIVVVGKKKADIFMEKVQVQVARVSSGAAAAAGAAYGQVAARTGAAYGQVAARTNAAYQSTKQKVSSTAADLYIKSGLPPQVERAMVAMEPVTAPLEAQVKATQAEMVRRLAPTAAWCSAEGGAALAKLRAALSAAASAAKLRALAVAHEAKNMAVAAKENVEGRAVLAKARAMDAAGDALFSAGKQLKAKPQVLVSKSVARFLMDLRNDLTGSPDRAALEAKYPQLLQELENLAASEMAVTSK
eukprot:CAMPEP_0118924786 /NCGR_PEP_ID=MMETSP1169-20130426/2756_1 /TAXON_ID=36882 /ORGANISM="Pyramimonas obovata, Strain CCMP722" /LENGTH=359 /DNA_ID=CAMNT_0006865919 /DNA_START=209 /DNA_END=1288 /DNA_ORIENTATION=+